MGIRKTRNGEIDFYRFVFAVVTMLFHSRYFMPDQKGVLFANGAYCVEFFAILSGYLMMNTVSKKENISDIPSETCNFIFRKYIAVFPEVFTTWSIGLVFFAFVENYSFITFVKTAVKGLPELFLVQMSGILSAKINSATWYISAMFVSMWILYPLLLKYRETMVRLIIPFIIFMLNGWLYQSYNHLRTPLDWTGFIYKGTLRMFLSICIGIFSYVVVQKINSFNYTYLGKRIITVLKYICLSVMIFYLWYGSASKYDFLLLPVWAIFVIAIFSDNGIDRQLFANKVCTSLGKLSLPIYLSHHFYAVKLNKLFESNLSITNRLLVYVAIVFVTVLIVIFVCKLLRKKWKPVIEHMKSLIIVQTT